MSACTPKPVTLWPVRGKADERGPHQPDHGPSRHAQLVAATVKPTRSACDDVRPVNVAVATPGGELEPLEGDGDG